jgi:hypothetical protein
MELLNFQTSLFSGYFNGASKRYQVEQYRKKQKWNQKSDKDKNCSVLIPKSAFKATFKYKKALDKAVVGIDDYHTFDYNGTSIDVIVKEGRNLYPLSGIVFEQLFYKEVKEGEE